MEKIKEYFGHILNAVETAKMVGQQKKLEAKIGFDMTKNNFSDIKTDLTRIFSEDWFEDENTKQIFILNILIQAGGEIDGDELYKKSGFSSVHLTFVLKKMNNEGLITIYKTGNKITKIELKKSGAKNNPIKKSTTNKFFKPIFLPS